MTTWLSFTSTALSQETEAVMVLPSFLHTNEVVFTVTYNSAAQLVDHLSAAWSTGEDKLDWGIVSVSAPEHLEIPLL